MGVPLGAGFGLTSEVEKLDKFPLHLGSVDTAKGVLKTVLEDLELPLGLCP
jgi:hypothetical protein